MSRGTHYFSAQRRSFSKKVKVKGYWKSNIFKQTVLQNLFYFVIENMKEFSVEIGFNNKDKNTYKENKFRENFLIYTIRRWKTLSVCIVEMLAQ